LTHKLSSAARLPRDILSAYPKHDQSLNDLFDCRANPHPLSPFLLTDDADWTYGEFQSRIATIANAISQQGVGRGDRVAVVALNSDNYVAIFFALARLGAILVPVNPDLHSNDITYILRHAAVVGVFCESSSHRKTESVLESLESTPWLILMEGDSGGVACLDDLVRAAIPGELPSPGSSDDTCLILYTSGTTGFPKGVMHRQQSFVLAAEAFVERMYLQPSDRLMVVLPLFHINALFYSIGGAVAAGASILLKPKFSASTFWQSAVDGNATEVNIISAIGNILARRPRSEFVSSHRLSKVYGAGMTLETMKTFSSEFGVPAMIEGYGLTEVPGVSNNPFNGEQRTGSIGLPSRHPDYRQFSEMRIQDEHGNTVPVNTIGEIVVRSPIVMQGYFRDEAATEAAFRDGWFLTGDLGYQDVDGYFYFVSRKKDIIRRRGENISGAEIDQVVSSHPMVLEAAAFAVPSELGEDEIMLAVVSKTGEAISPDEMAIWCQQRLSAMKCPRYYVQLDSLPHTPSHRIAKYRLKEDRSLFARATEMKVN